MTRYYLILLVFSLSLFSVTTYADLSEDEEHIRSLAKQKVTTYTGTYGEYNWVFKPYEPEEIGLVEIYENPTESNPFYQVKVHTNVGNPGNMYSVYLNVDAKTDEVTIEAVGSGL